MKKRIKRIIKPEREGFSLVEIIITIAIMAILIGVIALAVIPNIQRSRESTDLTKLDNIASSVNIAIANHQIEGDGQFTVGTTTSLSGDSKTVYDAVTSELGDLSQIEMGSSAARGGTIKVEWKIENKGAAQISVTVEKDSKVLACKYTTGDPSDADGNRLLKAGN